MATVTHLTDNQTSQEIEDEVVRRFKEIEAKDYGTRFIKSDLHFHTPSSSDARGPNKYGFNPYAMLYDDKIKDDFKVLKDIKGIDQVKRTILNVLKPEVLEEFECCILQELAILQKIKALNLLKREREKEQSAANRAKSSTSQNDEYIKALENSINTQKNAICGDIETMKEIQTLDVFTNSKHELDILVFNEIKVLQDFQDLLDPKKVVKNTNEEKIDVDHKYIDLMVLEDLENAAFKNENLSVLIKSFKDYKKKKDDSNTPPTPNLNLFKDYLKNYKENKDDSTLLDSLQEGAKGRKDFEKAIKTLTALNDGSASALPVVLSGIGSSDLREIKKMTETSDVLKKIEELSSQPLNDLNKKILAIESQLSDINVIKEFKKFKVIKEVKYPKNLREYRDQIEYYSRIKADQIVETLLDKGLSIAAITDHNGIGTIWADDKKWMDLAAPTWYELIDDAAKEAKEKNKNKNAKLVILPGVEISVTGVHILAIFPPQEPRRKVHFMICDLLNSVGIPPSKWGINSAVATMSPRDAIDLITKKGGLAIPAHIDGSDQALLKLHKLTSGAMKNVVGNENLWAVEILDTSRFQDQSSSLKASLEEVRIKNELPSLAYLQGSDSHDLLDIAKRSTWLKMTNPSFEGLKTALKMPASRVRFTDHDMKWNGLYIQGIAFDHPFLGKQSLHFNRSLNCIAGKIGIGKTTLHNLMQAAVDPECNYPTYSENSGTATLFVERIEEDNSKKTVEHYAFHRTAKEEVVKVYSIDPNDNPVQASKLLQMTSTEKPVAGMEDLIHSIQPKFFNAEKMKKTIHDDMEGKVGEDSLQEFLLKHFGEPTNPTEIDVKQFNRLFYLPRFLDGDKDVDLVKDNEHEMEKAQLLVLDHSTEPPQYDLKMNLKWRDASFKKTEDFVDFYSLTASQRKIAIMCMLLVGSIHKSKLLPVVIDAPEQEFDNEDMAKYLVPLILETKDTRQILLFTNHPILAVNTDPDNYVLMYRQFAKEKNNGNQPKMEVAFACGFAIDVDVKKEAYIEDVDESDGEEEDGSEPKASRSSKPSANQGEKTEMSKKELLLNILEGDLNTFRKRARRYEL